MKKVAYLLAVCLVGLSFMTAQPAFAAETHSSIISPVAESRSIYTAETTLAYSNGVRLHVTYTVNDTYGTITGIKSIKNWTSNSRVSNISWTHRYGLSNGSVVVTVTYYYNGSWHSEARTIYA